MKTFLVGGAVRDALLNLPVTDKDWVVTGSTPEAMLEQAITRSVAIFPFSCIPSVAKSMRWHVPSGKTGKATPVLSPGPRPT